jgi:transcriptional antiterminator RfaH
MSFWACARLVGHREHIALRFLNMRGFETYWPQIGGKLKPQALFPGYCFIWIELQWTPARWCPGVTAILLNGDQPAHVPNQVISELKGREDRRGFIRLPKRSRLNGGSLFAPGDQVRVKAGPMSGLSGLVQGLKPHQRIEVLLTMLGSLQRVELSAASVERIA